MAIVSRNRRAMRFSLIAAGIAALVLGASPAEAAKRLALVIGNNAYENVPKLMKAVNDADAVASELSKLGFEVVKAEDVGRRAMSRALVELEGKIGAGDTALIYFAGHGFAIDGTNYLLPVDVPIANPGEEGLIRDASFAATGLSYRLQEKGAGTVILILDACRDNPFALAGNKLHPLEQRLDAERVAARGCDPVRLPHRRQGHLHRSRFHRRARSAHRAA